MDTTQASGAEVVVCRLSRASVSDIADIEAESNSPPWSRKLFSDEFQHDYARMYGARLHGRLVSYLLLHTVLDEAHVVKFGVLMHYRGRGIGRALMREVLLELHQAAVRWVGLEVRKSNLIARRLYESFGFIEAGIRERYYSDNSEDACLMNLTMRDFVELDAQGLAAQTELRKSA